jgi:hypothetical protein
MYLTLISAGSIGREVLADSPGLHDEVANVIHKGMIIVTRFQPFCVPHIFAHAVGAEIRLRNNFAQTSIERPFIVGMQYARSREQGTYQRRRNSWALLSLAALCRFPKLYQVGGWLRALRQKGA